MTAGQPSQDPPSVPVSLIELSSQIILHKFNSPAWLKHIQKANAALTGLTPDMMAHLLGFPSQRGEILLKERRSSPMGETRRKFDKDFKEGAVRLVRETGKPIARVARDLGINEGTLGNWVNADQRRRDGGDGVSSEDERAELVRLRKENAELTMERDVLKRSVALWVRDAMGSR